MRTIISLEQLDIAIFIQCFDISDGESVESIWGALPGEEGRSLPKSEETEGGIRRGSKSGGKSDTKCLVDLVVLAVVGIRGKA